jgi:hypothetical protein
LKEGEREAGALAHQSRVPPCGRACVARGRPGSKGGSGIFCQGREGKKSSGPAARAALLTAAAPARSERRVGTEGWVSGSNKGMAI